MSLSFQSSSDPLDLHAFPTRRSSDLERTRWCAGSTPGGTRSFSASALAARIRRWRAMMMPLSVDTRFSLVRSTRSEEHTSELQSLRHLVCRLLLEKKKKATESQ